MSGPLRRGELTPAERDSMLAFMTDDVAALVLKDNYDQTLAISVAERTAARDLDAASALHARAGTQGPARPRRGIAARRRGAEGARAASQGLTRPELAVLLAYAKLDLLADLIESDLVNHPYFDRLLVSYFPKLAVENFETEIPHHRLGREIVATQLVNRLVNLAGPLFVHRMRELSNAPQWCIARAFALADDAFGLQELAARIDALDLKVPAATQIAMMADIAELLRRLGPLVHRAASGECRASAKR